LGRESTSVRSFHNNQAGNNSAEGDRGKYKIVYKVENYLQSEKRKFSVPGVE